MKRIIGLLVAVVVLFLNACGTVEPEQPPGYSLPLSGTVEITTDNTTYSGDWNFTLQEVMTFQLLKPEELHGITVRCSATENEMFLEPVSAPLGKDSVFLLLRKAWLRFLSGEVPGEQTPEGWRYDFSVKDAFFAEQSSDGKTLTFHWTNSKATAVYTIIG